MDTLHEGHLWCHLQLVDMEGMNLKAAPPAGG
jgi:hypothetical protein